MKSILGITAAASLATASILFAQGSQADHRPKITISVVSYATGLPIQKGETILVGDTFQVTVTTNGVDCAGQFVVTALGQQPGNTPAVLVQYVPIVMGPALGHNDATGYPLPAAAMADGSANNIKVSATCNGAKGGANQVAFDSFQFFVEFP